METNGKYIFKILPYIILTENLEFKIGRYNLIVSSYNNSFKNVITDASVEKQLNYWANAYLDGLGHEIKDITFIYFKDTPLVEEYTDEQEEIVNNVVQVLCYVLIADSAKWSRLSSDNFVIESITISTPKGDIYFSQRTGRKLIGGLKFGRDKIHAPVHVSSVPLSLQGIQKYLNEAFITVIERSLEKTFEAREYSRILRAIEWFNNASLDDMYNKRSEQILAMSIAFESLLNMPQEKITEYFKKTIQLLLFPSEELERWAKDFYTLRSTIVHGNKVDTSKYLYGEDKHILMFSMSEMVFTECVYSRLSTLNLIVDDRLNILRYSRMSKIKDSLISNNKRFDRILEYHDFSILNDDAEKCYRLYQLITTINTTDTLVTSEKCKSVKQKLEELYEYIKINELSYIDVSTMKHVLDDMNNLIEDLKPSQQSS